MIVERELHEITWYVVSVRLATPAIAKRKWEEIQRRSSGQEKDLGIYRHGPSTDPGRYLTAVTHRRDSALWINRLLRDCEGNGIADDEMLAMILRRIDFTANLRLAGAKDGSYFIRRPEVGAVLNPDGTMREPVRGEG